MLEWYDCEKCEVLLYATDILFDVPDIEQQREYRFYNILKRYWNYYNIELSGIYEEMKDLFFNECIKWENTNQHQQ